MKRIKISQIWFIIVFLISCQTDIKNNIQKKWKIDKVEVIYSEKTKQEMKTYEAVPEEEASKAAQEVVMTLGFLEFTKEGKYIDKDGISGSWTLNKDSKSIEMKPEKSKKPTTIKIEKSTSQELILLDDTNEDTKFKLFLKPF
jgi:hypothetical protein